MTDTAATTNPKGNPSHTVRGRIIHPDGSPVAGEHVQAFAKRLRKGDEPLGKPACTGEDGRYVIEYDPGKRRRVDLYVQVRCGKDVLVTRAASACAR